MGDDKPIRVQRKRTKGWKMPPNTISVARPSRFGNPFPVGNPYWMKADPDEYFTQAEAVETFKDWIQEVLNEQPGFLEPLRGKILACFCRLDQECHADILLELANSAPPQPEGQERVRTRE